MKVKKYPNQVRIIGGTLRGRKISFPDHFGLRPTPDRVRETLFNWLSPILVGARCLDLFAGSGVLGIEAISRGASSVVCVENNPDIVRSLHENVAKLQINNLQIIQASSLSWLQNNVAIEQIGTGRHPFDIVFLDPPYSLGILPSLFSVLSDQNVLTKDAVIYFENNNPIKETELPTSWKMVKEKKAGSVYYYLVKV